MFMWVKQYPSKFYGLDFFPWGLSYIIKTTDEIAVLSFIVVISTVFIWFWWLVYPYFYGLQVFFRRSAHMINRFFHVRSIYFWKTFFVSSSYQELWYSTGFAADIASVVWYRILIICPLHFVLLFITYLFAICSFCLHNYTQIFIHSVYFASQILL